MRYRGVCFVRFSNGKKISIEHIAYADDIDTANKICAIEFHGEYKQMLINGEVKSYHIIPCVEDTIKLPTKAFVAERLLKYNDHEKTEKERKQALAEIYTAFRVYQPFWDDDALSDILVWCEEGELLSKKKKLDEIVDELIADLDTQWCCHYTIPFKGTNIPSLDEQYEKAIDMPERYKHG